MTSTNGEPAETAQGGEIAAGASNRKHCSRQEMTQIVHSRSTLSVQKKTRGLPLRCWKQHVCRPLRPSPHRVIAHFRLKEIRWTRNSACSPRAHGTVMSHGIDPRLRPRNLLDCTAPTGRVHQLGLTKSCGHLLWRQSISRFCCAILKVLKPSIGDRCPCRQIANSSSLAGSECAAATERCRPMVRS